MEKIKILIPTDFTVQAEYAFLMVKKLEEKTPLDIHFLHVLSVPDTVYLDEHGDVQTCGEIDANYIRKQKDIADRKLANMKSIYGEEISTLRKVGVLNLPISSIFTNISAFATPESIAVVLDNGFLGKPVLS